MSDNNRNFIQKILDRIIEYFYTQAKLVFISFIEKLSGLLALLISSLVIFMFFLLLIVFISITGGFLVSHMFDSFVIGFGIIAIFYFLLFIILLIFNRTLIRKPITNSIIKVIFENFDTNEKDEKDQ